MSTLWFKAKRYGWGWYPATWQGWLIIAIYIALLVKILAQKEIENLNARGVFFQITLPILGISLALILISYYKGEKPSWRWGDKR